MKISKSILRFLVDTLFGQETYDEDPYLIKYRNSIDQTKYFKVRYLILFFIVPFAALAQSPIQFVDPLIGTAPATTESARKHSEAGSELKGQTFPGVGRPFGMTQWTPETRTTEDKCISPYYYNCLLYTSDAADEEDSVDLGGRRIIKK